MADERVMQLFGLVNALLAATEECARLDLGIQRYSVVPLSTNSGLIEWVPQVALSLPPPPFPRCFCLARAL